MILEILYIILALLIFIILCSIGYIISTYNRLQNGRQNILTQFGNIKTEYQRRADLFYNLVESVKSYAKFEKATLSEVIKNRNPNFNGSPATQVKKMKELDNFFSRLLVTMEKYPKLKAVEQYKELTDEIKMTENRINIGRTDLNEITREYNVIVVSFPSKMIAGAFGFREEAYFENEASTRDAPKIDMNMD